MQVRNNRIGSLALTFEGLADPIEVAPTSTIKLQPGLRPTPATRTLLDWGDVEDLEDGAERVTVRNATPRKFGDFDWPGHAIWLFAPVSDDAAEIDGRPRIKILSIEPGATISMRSEFLTDPDFRDWVAAGDLEVLEREVS